MLKEAVSDNPSELRWEVLFRADDLIRSSRFEEASEGVAVQRRGVSRLASRLHPSRRVSRRSRGQGQKLSRIAGRPSVSTPRTLMLRPCSRGWSLLIRMLLDLNLSRVRTSVKSLRAPSLSSSCPGWFQPAISKVALRSWMRPRCWFSSVAKGAHFIPMRKTGSGSRPKRRPFKTRMGRE